MFSVVFCQAEQDLELAYALGEYLAANLPAAVSYKEGLIGPGRDLIEAAGSALSAEVAVVILSPDSVPARWDRARWEPALLKQPDEFGSQLLFVLARPCKFPDLLKRHGFADATSGVLAAQREVKRGILRSRTRYQNTFQLPQANPALADFAALEGLRTRIADRPGIESDVQRETALAFAHAFKEDFEGAFWIDCAYRTAAGVLGDAGDALGLRLTGAMERNQAVLREFCEARKCLFLYENLRPEHARLLRFGGKSSSILVAASGTRPLWPLDRTLPAFSNWTQDPALCGQHLGDAYEHLKMLPSDWPRLVKLGTALVAFQKNSGRLAEADETLAVLIAGAEGRGDLDALHRFQWDRSWILGHWGEPYNSLVVPAQASTQLGFGFD